MCFLREITRGRRTQSFPRVKTFQRGGRQEGEERNLSPFCKLPAPTYTLALSRKSFQDLSWLSAKDAGAKVCMHSEPRNLQKPSQLHYLWELILTWPLPAPWGTTCGPVGSSGSPQKTQQRKGEPGLGQSAGALVFTQI